MGVVGAFILIAVVCGIPESPKYLYAKRRFDEARETLKIIARHNGNKLKSSEID